MLKVNKQTAGQLQCSCPGVFIINFEQIPHVALMSLLMAVKGNVDLISSQFLRKFPWMTEHSEAKHDLHKHLRWRALEQSDRPKSVNYCCKGLHLRYFCGSLLPL